jgi:hypothetical protein
MLDSRQTAEVQALIDATVLPLVARLDRLENKPDADETKAFFAGMNKEPKPEADKAIDTPANTESKEAEKPEAPAKKKAKAKK